MAEYGFDYLETDLRDGVAVVHSADPNDERLVPEAHPLHRELRDLFPALADDDRVRAVVLAGGAEAFTPFPSLEGLDRLLDSDPGAAARMQREVTEIVNNMIAFDKPLVAGVAAPAVGMGAQVAFLCDFIVTSRGVRFQDTHVRSGLASGDGATVVWPLLVGLAHARRYMLRGHPLTAEVADELGLVAELVDTPEQVLEQSVLLAAKLAALPAMAYRNTKRALNGWLRLGATTTLEAAAALELSTYSSPEFLAARTLARGQAAVAGDGPVPG